MQRGDQSNLVATYIKDREFSDLIDLRKNSRKWAKFEKSGSAHEEIPTRESRFRVRMLLREFVQAIPCDDMHESAS
jgi:hypothetical protein